MSDNPVELEQLLQVCGQTEPADFSSIIDWTTLSNAWGIGSGLFQQHFWSRDGEGNKMFVQINNLNQRQSLADGCRRVLQEATVLNMFRKLNSHSEADDNSTPNLVQATTTCVRLENTLLVGHDQEGHIQRQDSYFLVNIYPTPGQPLSQFKVLGADKKLSILCQVALSLAAAECQLQFEHRHLLPANVCVRSTADATIDYRVAGKRFSVATGYLKVTIITNCWSRLTIADAPVFQHLTEQHFHQQPDALRTFTEMRDAVAGCWDRFVPATNCIWLGYFLHQLSDIDQPLSDHFNTSNHTLLHLLRGQLGNCGSALDFVNTQLFSLLPVVSTSSQH